MPNITQNDQTMICKMFFVGILAKMFMGMEAFNAASRSVNLNAEEWISPITLACIAVARFNGNNRDPLHMFAGFVLCISAFALGTTVPGLLERSMGPNPS